MKLANIQTMLTLVTLGIAIALIVIFYQNSAAQNATQTEPQVVVVTATPLAEPATWTNAEVAPAASPTVASSPTTTTVVEPTPIPAGILVKGSDADIFYITEDGTRLHVYNRETLPAFGLADKDIVQVDEATLAAMLPAGELTPCCRTGEDTSTGCQTGSCGRLMPGKALSSRKIMPACRSRPWTTRCNNDCRWRQPWEMVRFCATTTGSITCSTIAWCR